MNWSGGNFESNPVHSTSNAGIVVQYQEIIVPRYIVFKLNTTPKRNAALDLR